MHILRLDNVDKAGNTVDRGNDNILVDIVAVHGMNEGNVDTWLDTSNLDNEVLWLRDLLPKAVRVARVLSIGYDVHASSFNSNSAVQKIQQHADTLVADLQADRSLESCSQRPIVFVCHGLGGLLVKKALAYSSTRTSSNVEHLHSIFTSTFAILFFGTPHRGADKANWLGLIDAQSLKQSFQSQKESKLLSGAEEGSETLQMITDQFAPLMKQFHIFFFWEQIPTNSGEHSAFIVEEASAAPILDNTERSGIYATHANMVKFSGSNDSSYRTIIEALTRYCRDAPVVIARRWKQATELISQVRSFEASELLGTGFDVHNNNFPFHYQRAVSEKPRNKHFNIPQGVSSIFTGREDVSQLVKCSLFAGSGRQQRRFVIHGIGGSGKTQFCCKFAQDYRESFWAVFYIDATSKITAHQSLAKIGKIGGLEATPSAGKHWLSHLEEPWLIIINNADDSSLDLPSLFPEGERGHILITTRNPDFRIHGSAGSTEFQGLEKEEALLLLLRAADIRSPWDSSIEDSGNKITNALGYLALALTQAGALILQKICDVTNYLDFYNRFRYEVGIRRQSKELPHENPHSIYSTWDLSLDSLERRHTARGRDATQLLSTAAFFHFEHIPVDLFIRALKNRSIVLEALKSRSYLGRLLVAFQNRLYQPPLLPTFLRQESQRADPYRIRHALHELRSFSLISYDGRKDTFSLHPVVHAWARDRLSPGEQSLWMHIARNTLAESILLPPSDTGKLDEDYRRDILPHLDLCLSSCPIKIVDFRAQFGGVRFPPAILLQYMQLASFREQVLTAAKFGYTYLERGRFDDAASLLAIAKDALVQGRGSQNELTMRAMLALAEAYWGLGRLDEALRLQKSVVEGRTNVLGTEHHQTLSAMDKLGRSYWLNGQYHDALDIQTLTTERMKRILGPDHDDTLAAMDNLGVTLGSWDRFYESMELHRKVLQFRERTLGATHVETLQTMQNLAMALLDLQRPDEAKELMLKVHTERKTKLGKEHPWTLWALCYLAKVDSSLGLHSQAEEMLKGGISAAKRSLGENHLGVLMGCGELARVYARQSRYEEADILARETLVRLEHSRGREHPDTIHTMWRLARLYDLRNKLEEAYKTCSVARKRVDMRLTKTHPLGKRVYDYHTELKKRRQSPGDRSSQEEIIPISMDGLDNSSLRIIKSRTL